MRRSRVAVIGLGNYLLSDEGTGLHAVELLRNREYSTDVDFVDAGTPGMNLLHQFSEREKIIFVDAGDCGLRPGEFVRFKPDEVVSLKKRKNYSLHEFDLIGFLEEAEKIGVTKNTDIVIYCMQTGEIKMSHELSSEVGSKLPQMTEKIYKEIEGAVYA